MAKRFDATISLPTVRDRRQQVELYATLVGHRGSNIRRITSKLGNGTYIRIFCESKGRDARTTAEEADSIYIASWSENAVREAAKMLKEDIRSVLTGSASSKPQLTVNVAQEAVGTIIGAGGDGLRRIMEFSGRGEVYIIHKKGIGFVITGNTTQQHAEAAVGMFQTIRPRLYRHSAGNFRHRCQKR